MKKIVLGIIVLLIIGIGYLYSTREEETVSSVSGEVVSVSLDQIAFDGPALIVVRSGETETTIAVPSMGLQLCPAAENIADVSEIAVGDKVEVSGDVDESGYIVPCADATHHLIVTSAMTDVAYGYMFEYRKGPDGYVTLEDVESLDASFVAGVKLFNRESYEELMQSTEARDGIPGMYVRVYRNDENLHAPVWAMRHTSESNSELATTEPQETVVGGANAVTYTTDGLYTADVYVVAHGDHTYVLMGSYFDEEDALYTDFKELVESFTFVPVSKPQGKIDVRVACESALMYMTFINGEEADAFVEACVEGEHPDVIDRYIQDMGLDGAVI